MLKMHLSKILVSGASMHVYAYVCRTRLLCGYICFSGRMVVSWSPWAYNMRMIGKHRRKPEESVDSVRARDNYWLFLLFLHKLYILCPTIGFSPTEAGSMTMEDNPSYSAVQEGLVMQPNPAYEQISG